jgi:rhamnosyltransferase
MTDPKVTIVLRSYNEAWALRETLPAIAGQEYRNWDLIAFDSGSTDGSVELLRAIRPRHLIEILPHEYQPGRVLNQGMSLASTAIVIFLNADATPQNANWLRPLVQALQEPANAAAFGRQIPRPNCAAVYAADYERCFGENRESAQWEHFFSMASSGLRKDAWARRGFLETMQYSEDDEYTRWLRHEGYQIVYCPESIVMHSHNYTPRQVYKRSFGEAWALAAVWGHETYPLVSRSRFWLGWVGDVWRDLRYCVRTRRLSEWPRAMPIRWEQRRGRRSGFKAGWAMHGASLAKSPTLIRAAPRLSPRQTVSTRSRLPESVAAMAGLPPRT